MKSIYINVKDKFPNIESIHWSTQSTMKNRITSHKSDSRLYPDRCALAAHANSLNHQIDYNSFKIIHKERNKTRRLFREMATTKLHKHLFP